jgi:hypothetical protein
MLQAATLNTADTRQILRRRADSGKSTNELALQRAREVARLLLVPVETDNGWQNRQSAEGDAGGSAV